MDFAERCYLPEELYYWQDHSWARIESNGLVRIGVDDFYQKEVGTVLKILLPSKGDVVSQGKPCGRIFSAGFTKEINSPVSGTVIEANKHLKSKVTLINNNPYGEGWIGLIKPSNLNKEIKNLLHGNEVNNWLKNVLKKQKQKRRRCQSCGFEMIPSGKVIYEDGGKEDKYYFCPHCLIYSIY